MSFWYEPKSEDMNIDGDDLDIYLDNDDSGARYVSLKVKDVKKLIALSEAKSQTATNDAPTINPA